MSFQLRAVITFFVLAVACLTQAWHLGTFGKPPSASQALSQYSNNCLSAGRKTLEPVHEQAD